METTPRHTQTKTINTLQKLERAHTKAVGYYETITMILDHHAFSLKLSARAVAALRGIYQGVFKGWLVLLSDS